MHATCYCLLPYYSRVNKKYRTRGGGGGGGGGGGISAVTPIQKDILNLKVNGT